MFYNVNNKYSMKRLEEIIDTNTEGNYLFSSTDKAQMMSEILDLFSVVNRFKATFDNEGIKDIEEHFWAENKDEAFNKVFDKYPKAKFVMI
jgi:hypothetical protein